MDTAEVIRDAVKISSADRQAQDEFVLQFYSLSTEVQAYLLPYLRYAVTMIVNGYTADRAAQEVFTVCMERKA